MNVKPAHWSLRIAAQCLDLALLAALLRLVAEFLPAGPPPGDSMAFFTPQDFINYFTLVALALLLTFIAFQIVKVTRATPGQKLLRLQLSSLNGTPPLPKQVNVRHRTAQLNMIFIMLPGPLIALAIGGAVAVKLNIPFSTADQLLMQLEIPKAIRYTIHGLSFLALFAAIWAIAIQPAIRYFERAHGGLTKLDIKSGTTHVLVRNA